MKVECLGHGGVPELEVNVYGFLKYRLGIITPPLRGWSINGFKRTVPAPFKDGRMFGISPSCSCVVAV
jgi:hypothetical protein